MILENFTITPLKLTMPSRLSSTAFQDLSLILLAVALPWSLAAMQIALGLVVLAHFLDCRKQGSALIRWNRLYWPLGLYLGLRLLSVIFAPRPLYSLRAFWSTDWIVFLVPVLVSLRWGGRRLQRFLTVLLFSSALAGAYGVFQALSGLDWFGHAPLTPMGSFYRAIGGYNFYLTFAGNQLLAFALGLGFFLLPESWPLPRGWLGAVLAILFLSLLGTFARSVWLAMAGLCLLALWLTRSRGLRRVLPAGILLAAGLIWLVPELRLRLFSIFDPALNENRLNLWHTAWRMIKAHPFLGIGPGMFNEVFEQYRVPGFYDATGHAHNDYFNTALNSGIPALLAWLAIWALWFYRGIHGWQSPDRTQLERAVLLGCLLGMAGILIAAFFQCYYTDLENNIFWWLIYSLGAVAQARISAARPSTA
ncbi:MAG: O-antigen ligase domain-containing protein [Calditrichaeota bacterium]|nr:MAG: O-antigen ligase domain-containing protein [Calditrichota bacterium]